MRRPVSRCVVGCPRQHACFEPIGHFVARAPGVAGEQPCQPISGKSLAPTSDVTVAAVQLGANLRPREPLGQVQNQTGVSCRIGSNVSGPRLALKSSMRSLGQCHHALRGRHNTPFLNVTVH